MLISVDNINLFTESVEDLIICEEQRNKLLEKVFEDSVLIRSQQTEIKEFEKLDDLKENKNEILEEQLKKQTVKTRLFIGVSIIFAILIFI